MKFSKYTRPTTLLRRVTMSCCKPSRQRLETKGCHTEYSSHSTSEKTLSQVQPSQLEPGLRWPDRSTTDMTDVVPSPQSEFGEPTRTQEEAIQAASICQSPFPSSRFACTISLCLALARTIADPTTCHAQSPSARTLPRPRMQ